MEPNPDYKPDPRAGEITPERFNTEFPDYKNPYKGKAQEDKNFYEKKEDFPGEFGNKDLGHEIESCNLRLSDNPDPDKV